jgi:hypothetical protein
LSNNNEICYSVILQKFLQLNQPLWSEIAAAGRATTDAALPPPAGPARVSISAGCRCCLYIYDPSV